MSIPAIRKNTPQTIQSHGTTPPPQTSPQPSAASVADDAAGRINELRGSRRVRGGRISQEQAVSMLARTYERAGISGVNELLLASPRLVASLGGSSREELESALAEQVGSWDAGSVAESIQEQVTLDLREGIRQTAQRRIAGTIDQISTARDRLAGELEALGTPPRDVQRATELEFLIQQADNSIAGYRALSARFDGQAWEVGDFPRTTVRLATRAGMGDLMEGTFAGEALQDTSGVPEAIAAKGAKIAEFVVEAPHIAHAFAHEGAAMGGLALGTFAAGIAVGFMIHHAAEENREAFIAAGREQLGL